jgi:2-amino-4-hydroxy-6-hydroxymethyldihydropteridine diphosphokinase
MFIVYIGIGSNLGDRHANCIYSIDLLGEKGTIVRKKSSLYETDPWRMKDQPKFLNMAVEIETDLSPEHLLVFVKKIEKKMGRKESFQWGPRLIDLDILLYDNIVINKEDLKIPHPLMHERDFVLRPLYEIAPDVKHPLLQLSVKELFQRLSTKSALKSS